MAWISDTSTGIFASGMAASMVSNNARHSALPVASNLRSDRIPNMNQSMAAMAAVGLPAVRLFVREQRSYPSAYAGDRYVFECHAQWDATAKPRRHEGFERCG
jgi:hypothetical protein